jgi:hypothetical protein
MEAIDDTELGERVRRLEDAVFGATKKSQSPPSQANYSGATGGIRFLIENGNFKKKMGLGEVRAALAEQEYHYSKQAVHDALCRLASKDGPLVSLKENGKKLYVKRK